MGIADEVYLKYRGLGINCIVLCLFAGNTAGLGLLDM